VQSLIEHGQRAGTFRRDLPQQWLVTTAYSLMHAAAEDAADRLDPDDTARLITVTLLAAFTRRRASEFPGRSALRSFPERATVSAPADRRGTALRRPRGDLPAGLAADLQPCTALQVQAAGLRLRPRPVPDLGRRELGGEPGCGCRF